MGNQGSKLYKLLETTSVGELIESKQGKIVMVTCNNTLNEAITLMRDNKIHSLPLWEERFNQDRGLVDVGDIVAYFYSIHQKNNNLSSEELKELFLNSNVTAKLADFSHQNFCSAVKPQDNLLRLVRSLSGDDRLQRVILLDESNNISNIIGQSLVLRFLYEHVDALKTYPLLSSLSNFASSLNIGPPSAKKVFASDLASNRPLKSLPDTTNAVDAFYFLNENKLRSVPILDADGKIVGNISTSDIIGLSLEFWDLLNRPVLEYLKGVGRFRMPVTIKSDLKFKRVLGALHDHQIHHVYLVDDQNHATGVVSVSDVLLYFKNHGQ